MSSNEEGRRLVSKSFFFFTISFSYFDWRETNQSIKFSKFNFFFLSVHDRKKIIQIMMMNS
jgi:hypothetical protein